MVIIEWYKYIVVYLRILIVCFFIFFVIFIFGWDYFIEILVDVKIMKDILFIVERWF